LAVFDSDFVQAAQTAAAFPVFGGLGLEATCQDAGEPVASLASAVLALVPFQDVADLVPGQELLGEEGA
jgi:hypothetical protein